MNEIEILIQAEIAAIDGEILSRSRVLDSLLDLRLAADDRADLVVLVDDALRDLPGKTMVQASWWHERLSLLDLTNTNPSEPAGSVS